MARFIPKQFAENSTTSVVFGSHQEQGGNPGDGTISSDPATLQGGTAWPLGWSAATDNFFQIPRGEEMEGLERVLSAAIIQQFKDGLTFWQSEMPVTQYQTIVQYQTGSDLPKLYINITGASTSTPPDSDTTNWFMFFDTAQVSANVALTNSPYTTNRILEIPQDIKLELNNGTLALKAGSKVYVPNGAGVFDAITVENDITFAKNSSAKYFCFLKKNGDFSDTMPVTYCYSGSTAPTITHTFAIWYDTTNNKIKWTNDNGSTWTEGYSLPIAIILNDTPGTQNATSIDQVFNGFGYIGSTVFVLPGVKCQSTFERNADGTYKSDIIIVDKVLTGTRTDTSKTLQFYIQKNTRNEISLRVSYHYYTSKTIPTTGAIYSMVWCEEDGCWYFSSAENSFSKVSFKVLRVITYETDENGKITSFKPYNVDSVLNSSLSNLSAAGEAHFANPSLSNLTNGLANTICTTPATTTSTASSSKPAVVVANYRSGDNWYRVWSDGWIEQGGYTMMPSTSNNVTVNLNKAFSGTGYQVLLTAVSDISLSQLYPYSNFANKTTSSFKVQFYTNNGFYWKACGY